jgi:hypothetical protein
MEVLYIAATTMSSISERFMEEAEEPTWEERARAVLDRLTITTPEGVISGEGLPDWLAQPWAASFIDPHDPDYEASIVKAEAWLTSH